MRSPRLFALASLLALACGETSPSPEHAPSPVRSTGDASDPTLLARARASLADCHGGAFLDLWAELDDAQKQALAASEDTSVALQARWELERRVRGEALDPAGVDRFLAFVGERIGPPPAWWADALSSARFHPQTSTTSYDVIETLARDFAVRHTIGGATIHTRSTLTIVEAGDGIVLLGEGGSVPPPNPPPAGQGYRVESPPEARLPLSAIQTSGSFSSHLAAYVTPSFAILAPFSAGTGGFEGSVRRYDAGAPRWEATVCGGGRQVLGGEGAEVLELAPRAGGLVLRFGAESHAVYVDALELETGALAFRFNSDLWFARHGRTP